MSKNNSQSATLVNATGALANCSTIPPSSGHDYVTLDNSSPTATLDDTSMTSSSLTSTADMSEDSSALMYIVVVLLFYAVCMTLLMVKYVKREREEALLNYYFNEFVKRDTFNSKKFVFDKRTAKRYIITKYIDKSASSAVVGKSLNAETTFLETSV